MQEISARLLSTRMVEPALVESARSAGIVLDALPFISVSAIDNAALRTQVQAAAERSQTVIFTSANAVDAVKTLLQNYRPDWRIYCLGEATAKQTRALWGEQQILGTAISASALTCLVSRHDPKEDLLFFCGNWRRDELPDQLRKLGISLREIVVYETQLTPKKTDIAYDGILFFSPSGVESFFSVNTAGKAMLFAIGETTALEVKKYANNSLVISDRPSAEALITHAIKIFHDQSLPIEEPRRYDQD